MAQINSNFDFTGPLGNVSAYKMRGVERTILRTPGGQSREKIKNHPNFRVTRLNNFEFGGCSLAAKLIRKMLWPQQSVADYNISGPLTALVKPIQAMDMENGLGNRNIIFSKST